MDTGRDKSIQDEIRDASFGRPHIVILGAGASVAAVPNGDKHGRKLPVMANLIEVLGLEKLLARRAVDSIGANFEQVYSQLVDDGKLDLAKEIEDRVFDYFSSLQLPDTPTIYDHLVLSMRSKDVIATFNWDPFLWQACQRNHKFARLPHLLFLHGNVGFGVCKESRSIGPVGGICSKTGLRFERTPLLFPVAHKDYNKDDLTKTAWDLLKMSLKHAYIVTVFGYGAPQTDVEAVALMKEAWGGPEKRNLEEIEIIDIKHEEELTRTWKDFIHTHHYQVSRDFYESSIANHPRRSCEAMWNRLMECQFLDKNPIPRNLNFQETWRWYSEFLKYETEI
jgi:hypothetical protein